MPKEFRLESKNLFLTFPQTTYPLEDFKANCLKLFEAEGIEKLLISTEKHQDGNDHIHAVICLQKPLRTRRSNHFDGLVQPPKHPNIVSRFRGGLAKTLSYVMKDGNWISHPEEFNPTTLIQKSSNKKEIKKTDAIAHRMEKGETIEDLLQDEAGFVLMHLERLREFSAYLAAKGRRTSLAEARSQGVRVQVAAGHMSSSATALALWLNQNLRNPALPRRRKQLWLKAPPQHGKTTLITNLEEWFNLSIYYMPKTEDWNDLYNDGEYDLVVLDEYKGHKSIQFLNPWLSNDPQPVSRRGKAPIMKRDALPFIILSNYRPEEAYRNASPISLEALLSRLEVIEFSEGDLIRLEKSEDSALAEAEEFTESGEPAPDPNLDDSHLAPHPIFSGPIELPPPPPPLPDPLDVHLCSTSELNDGQWLLSSDYRNEASSRISKRAQRELESSKSKPVKRVRRLYKFFDLEASDSEKESGDDSEEQDAYDLNDPFINDDEECEELSTTSSPP